MLRNLRIVLRSRGRLQQRKISLSTLCLERDEIELVVGPQFVENATEHKLCCGRKVNCAVKEKERKKRKWKISWNRHKQQAKAITEHAYSHAPGSAVAARRWCDDVWTLGIIWVFRGRYERRAERQFLMMKNPQSRTTDKPSAITHTTFVGPQQRLERRSRKAISRRRRRRYCKEIVGFESRRCLHKHSQKLRRQRIGHEKQKSREANTHDHIQQSLGSRVIFHRLYAARSASDDLWEKKISVSIFHFFFFLVYFLTVVFSVQFVNSSLTHDVPPGSYRWFFILFLLPLWSQAKERKLSVELSGYCSRCQWTIGSDFNWDEFKLNFFLAACSRAITRQLNNWQIAEDKKKVYPKFGSLSDVFFLVLRVLWTRMSFSFLKTKRRRRGEERLQI